MAESLLRQLEKLTVAELKAELEERGSSTSGKKAELRERLEHWLAKFDDGSENGVKEEEFEDYVSVGSMPTVVPNNAASNNLNRRR